MKTIEGEKTMSEKTEIIDSVDYESFAVKISDEEGFSLVQKMLLERIVFPILKDCRYFGFGPGHIEVYGQTISSANIAKIQSEVRKVFSGKKIEFGKVYVSVRIAVNGRLVDVTGPFYS